MKLGKAQSSQHGSNICGKCQVKLGQAKSSNNRSSKDGAITDRLSQDKDIEHFNGHF